MAKKSPKTMSGKLNKMMTGDGRKKVGSSLFGSNKKKKK
jgi:hypothetical protein